MMKDKQAMSRRSERRTAVKDALIVAAFALTAFARDVLAQTPAKLPPDDGGYMQWVVFGGIAIVVCATGFLNSKRSHLN